MEPIKYMTDEEFFKLMKEKGIQTGPVNSFSRRLYEKKYLHLFSPSPYALAVTEAARQNKNPRVYLKTRLSNNAFIQTLSIFFLN